MAVFIYMLHEPLTARPIQSSVRFEYVIVFVMLRQHTKTANLQLGHFAVFFMIIKTRIEIETRR